MAKITARLIVTVALDDGREYAFDRTKDCTGPDDTQWGLDVLASTLGQLLTEDAADAIQRDVVTDTSRSSR